MNAPRSVVQTPHFSVVGLRINPRNMQRLPCTHDQSAALMNVALEMFADVCNSGHTFQEALVAVYLSGLNHGAELTKEGA